MFPVLFWTNDGCMQLCIRLLVIVLLVLISAPVFAVQLLLKPSLGVNEIYTNNVSPLNYPGTEDLITEVTPGLSLQADGSRLDANVGLTLENFFSAKQGRNVMFHDLTANASAELIRDFAFLNLKAINAQRVLSSSRGGLWNNFNKDNRTDISSWLVNPHLKKRFGGKAEGSASYSYEELSYGNEVSGAKIEGVKAGLKSGPSFQRMAWSVNYSKKTTKRGTASDFSRAAIIAEASYQVYEKLGVLFDAGDERNDRASTQTQGYQNGPYYAAGIRVIPHSTLQIDLLSGSRLQKASLSWIPTHRSALNILWRDQKTGRNPGEVLTGSLQLINRRVVWNASYVEDNTSTQSSGSLTSGSQGGGGIGSLSNARYKLKRKQTALGYKTAKSLVRIEGYKEHRIYTENNNHLDFLGGEASWRWRFATRTTMLLRYQRSKKMLFSVDNSQSNGKTISADISFSRKIGRGVEGSIMAVRTFQSGLVGGRGYNEKRLSAGVTWRF